MTLCEEFDLDVPHHYGEPEVSCWVLLKTCRGILGTFVKKDWSCPVLGFVFRQTT